MHKRFYLTIIIVLAGIVALRFFSFGELIIEQATVPDYYVVGYEYYGLAQDERVKNALQEIDVLLKDNKLSGNLGVWYYGNPDQTTDSLKVVVGAFSTDSTANHSEVLVKQKIAGGQVIRTAIDPFAVFAPTPDEVTEKLIAYGQQIGYDNQLTLYAEKYMLDSLGNPKVLNEIRLKKK